MYTERILVSLLPDATTLLSVHGIEQRGFSAFSVGGRQMNMGAKMEYLEKVYDRNR